MKQVILYSGLLLIGIILSQTSNVLADSNWLSALTLACLAYIMIGVGLDLEIDKTKLRSYGWDFLISISAAGLPWLLVAVYFIIFLDVSLNKAFLIGIFAAPTSAGVLLSMLAAAGLVSTWVYSKVRMLVIFDDLATVVFMIPLQIIMMGFRLECFVIILIIIILLASAYIWLHKLKWPTGKLWLIAYSIIILIISEWITHAELIHHLEVLIPSFVLGCLLSKPKEVRTNKKMLLSEKILFMEPHIDLFIKSSFMFLVGWSIPKIVLGQISIPVVIVHVLALTVLCNLGKCIPLFGYRNNANFQDRLALSVALFPRGEVGAGVLLIAMSYGFDGLPITMAGLSLVVNLLMTGFFIYAVKRLIRS